MSVPVPPEIHARTTVEYSIDADGRIDSIAADVWNHFALANGAPELTWIDRILGTPLETFITGELPLRLYRRMFERLRGGEIPGARYDFRCDAPAMERDLRLDVVARFDGTAFRGLSLRSIELATRSRPSVALLERTRTIAASLPLLRMCSYCKDVFDESNGTWRRADDYLAAGGEAGVHVSHGACPRCFEAVMRTMD